MGDYIPKKDTEYQNWLGNLITVANANFAALGLVAADVTPHSNDKTNYMQRENPPCLKTTYRIKAQQGEIQSPPSNTVVVNDGGMAAVGV